MSHTPIWRGPAPPPGTLSLCRNCVRFRPRLDGLRRCAAVNWNAQPLPLEPNTYPAAGHEHCGCFREPEPDPPLLAGVEPLEMIA